jgi:hypothetical protein
MFGISKLWKCLDSRQMLVALVKKNTLVERNIAGSYDCAL